MEGAAAASRVQRERSKWTSPLVLAVLAATVAATGNAWVAHSNGKAQRALEESWSSALLSLEAYKVEAALVLEAIATGDPDAAALNLSFLLEAGFVDDHWPRAGLAAYLEKRERGQDPALRSPSTRSPQGPGIVAQVADVAEPSDPHASDGRVTTVQYRADGGENGLVSPPLGANGAGLDAFADPRLGAWANSEVPARFGRFTSGLKVGDAVTDTGGTGGSGTWLADIGLGGPGASWDYMARSRITSLSTNSLIGGTFAARRTGKASGNPIGLVAVAAADSPNAEGAYGIYSETLVGPRSPGGAAGVEFNTVNTSELGAAGDILPYGTGKRGMTVLNLAVGGDRKVHGATEAISAFTTLRGNGGKAKAGLVFKENALLRLGDSDTGYGRALSFPQAYGHSWYGGTDHAEVFRLYSAISDAAHSQAMSFSDDGVRLVRGLGESTALYVPFVAGSVNYVQLSPASGGRAVEVAARGRDTDIDLLLEPKGSGVIDVGYEAEAGAVEPTHRAMVRFNGIPYYIALDPA